MRAYFGKDGTVPGLRQVARFASATVFGISAALVLALVLVGIATSRAIQRVSDSASDAAVVGALEGRFRSHERLAALHRFSGNEAYELQRQRELAQIESMLNAELSEKEHDENERRVIVETQAAIERHLAAQRALEISGRSHPEILQGTLPTFSSVLAHMMKLQSIHQDQIARARHDAEMLRTATLGAGTVALALLASTLLGCLVILRRWVFRPLSDVARALERMSRGDHKAKISQPVPVEMGELAGSVNYLSDALEGRNANQVRYLGMLAHDLRNPLTGLRLTFDRLSDCALPSTERARACELIGKQLDRFDRMVQELLDAARLESGKMDVRLQPADLSKLAADVVELHRATCPNELRLATPPSPVEALVDPMRIEQVLGNLVLNAIHHSPDGGPIDVVVKPSAGDVCMSVTDRGPGIPRDLIDQLFTPFFQRSARDGAQGAGLGLAIVRQIVEAHGGCVEVDSEVGQGSTFRVRLPRDRPTGRRSDEQCDARACG
jgi:signal transduction histidine kinase